MSKKAHYKWIRFINESQKPLFPPKNKPFGPMPTVRIDPENSHPDDEHDVPEAEAEMLFKKLNSKTPAGGMKKSDRDFEHPNQNLDIKFSDITNFEAADTWDIKDDERIKKAIDDFNKVKGNLPTLDLKKLQELIVKEVRVILDERKKANIHRKK